MNITLIGMPGSGKSTVGRILARELGISPDEVCKNRPGSRLLTGTMGEADHENH